MAVETLQIKIDYRQIQGAIEQLKNLQKYINNIGNKKVSLNFDGKSISAMTKKIDELKSELNSLDSKKATVKVNADTKELEQQLGKVDKRLNSFERVGKNISQVGAGIYAFGNALDQLGDSMNVVDSIMSNIINKGLQFGTMLAGLSVGGLTAFVKTGLESTNEMMITKNSIGAYLQNAKATNDTMVKLTNKMIESPISDSAIMTNFQRYLTTYDGDLERSFDLMNRTMDIAGATGADYNRLGLAVSQILQYGKLRAQERNQLVENGVGGLFDKEIMRIYREQGGTSSREDAQADGELTADIFYEAVKALTEKGGVAYGGQSKATSTLKGRTEQIKGEIDQMARDFIGYTKEGDVVAGSFLETVMNGFDKVNKKMFEFSQTETYQKIQKGLTDLARSALNFVEKFDFTKVEQSVKSFVNGFMKEFDRFRNESKIFDFFMDKIEGFKKTITDLGNGNFSEGLGRFVGKFIEMAGKVKIAKIGTELSAGVFPLVGMLINTFGHVFKTVGGKIPGLMKTNLNLKSALEKGIDVSVSASGLASGLGSATSSSGGIAGKLSSAFGLALKGAFAGIAVSASVWTGIETIKKLQRDLTGIKWGELTENFFKMELLVTAMEGIAAGKGFLLGLSGGTGLIGIALSTVADGLNLLATKFNAGTINAIKEMDFNGLVPKIKQYGDVLVEMERAFNGKAIEDLNLGDVMKKRFIDLPAKMLDTALQFFSTISAKLKQWETGSKLDTIKDVKKILDLLKQSKKDLEEVSKLDFSNIDMGGIKDAISKVTEAARLIEDYEPTTVVYQNGDRTANKVSQSSKGLNSKAIAQLETVKNGLKYLKQAFTDLKALLKEEETFFENESLRDPYSKSKITAAFAEILFLIENVVTEINNKFKEFGGENLSVLDNLGKVKAKIEEVKKVFETIKKLVENAQTAIDPNAITTAVTNINNGIVQMMNALETLGDVNGEVVEGSFAGATGLQPINTNDTTTGGNIFDSVQSTVAKKTSNAPLSSAQGMNGESYAQVDKLKDILDKVKERVDKIKEIHKELESVQNLPLLNLETPLKNIDEAIKKLDSFLGQQLTDENGKAVANAKSLSEAFNTLAQSVEQAIGQLESAGVEMTNAFTSANDKIDELQRKTEKLIKTWTSGFQSMTVAFNNFYITSLSKFQYLATAGAIAGENLKNSFINAIQGLSYSVVSEIQAIQTALNSLRVPNLSANVNYNVTTTGNTNLPSSPPINAIPSIASFSLPASFSTLSASSTNVTNNYYNTSSPTINQTMNNATQNYSLSRANTFLRGL